MPRAQLVLHRQLKVPRQTLRVSRATVAPSPLNLALQPVSDAQLGGLRPTRPTKLVFSLKLRFAATAKQGERWRNSLEIKPIMEVIKKMVLLLGE